MSTSYHAVLGILGVDNDSDTDVSIKLDIEIDAVDDFLERSKQLQILAFEGNIRNEEQNPLKRKRKNSNVFHLDAIISKSSQPRTQLLSTLHP